MPVPDEVERGQKTCVELSASTATLVKSLAASTSTSERNSAATCVSACKVSWQVVALPLQAPPQLPKRVPPAGASVRVTVLPPATMTSQTEVDSPQLRPAPVTVPGPVTVATRCT